MSNDALKIMFNMQQQIDSNEVLQDSNSVIRVIGPHDAKAIFDDPALRDFYERMSTQTVVIGWKPHREKHPAWDVRKWLFYEVHNYTDVLEQYLAGNGPTMFQFVTLVEEIVFMYWFSLTSTGFDVKCYQFLNAGWKHINTKIFDKNKED